MKICSQCSIWAGNTLNREYIEYIESIESIEYIEYIEYIAS